MSTLTVKAAKPGIGASNVDVSIAYVSRKFRKSVIARELAKLPVGKKRVEDGFLLVAGDKPGMQVHPVKWDGYDFYGREIRPGVVKYGRISALNRIRRGFSVAVVSLTYLVSLAVKFNKCVRVTKVDGTQTRLCLINSIGSVYVAAFTEENGKWIPRTWEKSGYFNHGYPYRFTDYSDEKIAVKPLLNGLVSRSGG